MKHNPAIVTAFLASHGIPEPFYEVRFNPGRKWRFDLCWPDKMLALEIQGGIWTQGRHSRGAALIKEWEKLNTAAMHGWRILYCQPKDLLKDSMAQTILRSLDWRGAP